MEGAKRDSKRTCTKNGPDDLAGTRVLRCFIYNCFGSVRSTAASNRTESKANIANYVESGLLYNTLTCNLCGEIGHKRRYCWNSPPPQAIPLAEGSIVEPFSQSYEVGCAVQVRRVSENVKEKILTI